MTEQTNWALKVQQLEADIAQVNRLNAMAERPKVKEILEKEQSILKSRLAKMRISLATQNTKPKQEQQNIQKKNIQVNVVQKPTVNYTALTKYSWEDEKGKVKIYFTLENIGNQCSADKIDVQYYPNSLQVRIRDYKKQNLNFSIKKTFGKIIPEQCKFLVKTNLLSITLVKQSTGTWTQLAFKEDKFKSEKKEKQTLSDPNASLMNMMKEMYESGDETMKKTIAQAWTKAQDKKEGGPGAFKM